MQVPYFCTMGLLKSLNLSWIWSLVVVLVWLHPLLWWTHGWEGQKTTRMGTEGQYSIQKLNGSHALELNTRGSSWAPLHCTLSIPHGCLSGEGEIGGWTERSTKTAGWVRYLQQILIYLATKTNRSWIMSQGAQMSSDCFFLLPFGGNLDLACAAKCPLSLIAAPVFTLKCKFWILMG